MFACRRTLQPLRSLVHCVGRESRGNELRRSLVSLSPSGKGRTKFFLVAGAGIAVVVGVGWKINSDMSVKEKTKDMESLLADFKGTAEVAEKSAGDFPQPRPLVVTGPPGVGKTTLLRKLFEEFPNAFGFCIWHTTREMRSGEVDGVDFHFVSEKEMTLAKQNDIFLETAEFDGKHYGTSKRAVADVKRGGRICVLDTSMQGIQTLKKTDLEPIYVLLKPASFEELEKRLRGRNDSEEIVRKEISAAKDLLNSADESLFDLVIINKNLDESYQAIKDAIQTDLDKVKKIREQL